MCGIVGHLGPNNPMETVLEGLSRLEYRGYDSAGVAYVDDKSELHFYKKTGKLANLVSLLEQKKHTAVGCIGHTRWATHGEVNDANSHPHTHGKISIVHNGIIENAPSLKSELASEGFKFQSETDSEVFLALVSLNLEKGLGFLAAVSEAFKRTDGNSAFVVLNAETSEILAIKRGAPLVAGLHEANSDASVSSDPYALVGSSDTIFFPGDEVLVLLSKRQNEIISFYELDGSESKNYKSKKQEMSLEVTDKGEFEHFMLKEIYEQPGLIRDLIQYYLAGAGAELLEKVSAWRPKKFHISACGTAAYAGMIIRDFIEDHNRIPCTVELASEFRYRNPLLKSEDVGLFISQSGETADTLAAQNLCVENNLKTLAIVNTEGSTLYRSCTENLLIKAGIEIGVASTKAFTQQSLTGCLLSYSLAGDLKTEDNKKIIADKFSLLAERIDDILDRADELKSIAQEIYNYKGFFFTGRGKYFPVALEGALKLKEIAYVHAEGYASGELKHGPIALIDDQMVNIAIVGPKLFDKTISNIQEIKARRGIIVGLGPKGAKDLDDICDFKFDLNFEGLEDLSPLYVNVANQLLAYYMAKFKGTDIDKPRNLAKSVTVE